MESRVRIKSERNVGHVGKIKMIIYGDQQYICFHLSRMLHVQNILNFMVLSITLIFL